LSAPEHLEVARILLEKASGDLAAVELLAGDDAQADHVIGLHAQQAVEKSLKAVPASRRVEIPRTHDIGYLEGLCRDVHTPVELFGAAWLTPWAGGWRYDAEASAIDRRQAVDVARRAVLWGRSVVGAL